ncbi:MAG: hypothetical protein L6437_08560 [Kiritimatiellae bacterium]|nr:hypothetical protein [Verrucomicrobiota bacterium]MCG2660281.1 hypothetical protein [Kiritimatiellia bacterium]
MGNTWVTNMLHSLDNNGVLIRKPGPACLGVVPSAGRRRARRLAEYFGSIVEAVTARPRDEADWVTAIQCPNLGNGGIVLFVVVRDGKMQIADSRKRMIRAFLQTEYCLGIPDYRRIKNRLDRAAPEHPSHGQDVFTGYQIYKLANITKVDGCMRVCVIEILFHLYVERSVLTRTCFCPIYSKSVHVPAEFLSEFAE